MGRLVGVVGSVGRCGRGISLDAVCVGRGRGKCLREGMLLTRFGMLGCRCRFPMPLCIDRIGFAAVDAASRRRSRRFAAHLADVLTHRAAALVRVMWVTLCE